MTTGSLGERRAGEERRETMNRRSGTDRRCGKDRRVVVDRRSNLVYLITEGGQRRSNPVASRPAILVDPRTPPLLEEREFSLLDAASQAYDAAVDPKLWPKALAGLCAILDADAVVLAEHDAATGSGHILHCVGMTADGTEAYEWPQDPQSARPDVKEAAAQPGTVAINDGSDGGSALNGGRAWLTWVQEQGFLAPLCGVVDNADGVVTRIHFLRATGKDGFGEDDAALLGRLIPAVQRGIRAGRALRRAQFFHQVAFDALDVVPIGVAFVDGAGAITAANRIARQIIEGENVRAYQETVRRAQSAARPPRLGRAVADAMSDLRDSGGDALSAFAVPRKPGLRPLTCLLAPLGGNEGYSEGDGPSAMLFIGDPDRPMEIDQRRLRQLYGLSRAEARVVALLAQGYKLDATAESLGLVYETVRKHLKQVFDKTGCDRQAELVRLLVTGPATIPLT
ncbi:MAG: helix-turn-helix transcriptional regulator [Rhodospirillales bacterium]|nr:helix-turn-helix transcriptional regulator [Rhodospirillales bacterium]